MTKVRSTTALATLAIAFGFGGAAQADPFADGAVSIQRVTSGTGDNGITLMTLFDDGDDGSDATGMSDYDVFGRHTYSTLGIDQKGTLDTSDDVGGVVVLDFTDNVCLADVGMDLDVYDGGNDESALVEASYDGVNFYTLGEVTPGAYELDADGTVPFFTQVRITATDRNGLNAAGWDFSAGMDVDAVECLNSIDAEAFAFDVDSCDLTSGDPGLDVDFVLVHSDGFSAYVELFFCGAVTDSAQYAVHFGSPDAITLASTETTTTQITSTSTKGKKGQKANSHSANSPNPNQQAYDNANDNARFKRAGGDGSSGGTSTGGACGMVPGHSATYSAGIDSGGLVFVNDRRMSVEVSYAEMGAFQGDSVMLWVETTDGSDGDYAPNTDGSDGCNSAENVDETVIFTLQ